RHRPGAAAGQSEEGQDPHPQPPQGGRPVSAPCRKARGQRTGNAPSSGLGPSRKPLSLSGRQFECGTPFAHASVCPEGAARFGVIDEWHLLPRHASCSLISTYTLVARKGGWLHGHLLTRRPSPLR